jgi:nucleotide-binding universal stress UspA family protein
MNAWFEGKTAVVPIDFGDLSKKAVDTALEIVFRPADIHVIHVAPDLAVMAPEVVWQEVSDETRCANIEENFHRVFSDEKYRHVKFHVAFGDPGHQITDYAQEIGADMILIPSHGRTGIQRLFMGSVAERVIRLAHCPVLVLKE